MTRENDRASAAFVGEFSPELPVVNSLPIDDRLAALAAHGGILTMTLLPWWGDDPASVFTSTRGELRIKPEGTPALCLAIPQSRVASLLGDYVAEIAWHSGPQCVPIPLARGVVQFRVDAAGASNQKH
jgi:hypothetical protein